LTPNSPNYFFVPRTEQGREFYESLWSTSEIFVEGSTGVLSGRDRLVIAQTESELNDQLNFVRSSASDRDVEVRFGLKRVEHWSLSDARGTLREEGIPTERIRNLAYRPFDIRVYYDHDALVFRSRRKIMEKMRDGNIGLTICRLTKGGAWTHCLVADEPTDDSYVSDKSKERAYLFPLYWSDINSARIENVSARFRAFLDARYEHHYAPEELVGYVYAVLYAPIYRTRYAEFLRIGFPRVPLPEVADDFEALSGLGWALAQAHLLRELPRRGLANYHGRGNHTVEAVRYVPAEAAIAINKTQFFKPMPQAVWDFRMGGYQVLDKYLKSRRGRVLSLDEIEHIGAVADSLAFTIEQMARIDAAYRSAFPDQA
jgi:hypothetical protein